jgi:hypothetical protein
MATARSQEALSSQQHKSGGYSPSVRPHRSHNHEAMWQQLVVLSTSCDRLVNVSSVPRLTAEHTVQHTGYPAVQQMRPAAGMGCCAGLHAWCRRVCPLQPQSPALHPRHYTTLQGVHAGSKKAADGCGWLLF